MPGLISLPSSGWRNPGIPGNVTRVYRQGAVAFSPSSNVSGGSAVAATTTSRYGVISFWYAPVAGTANPSISHFRQVGAVVGSPHSWDPAAIFTMNAYVNQTPANVNQGTLLGLDLYSNTGTTLFNGWIYTANTPPTGWHHVIWSWDAGQTNICPAGSPVTGLPILRVQAAFDRGGTGVNNPAGGVYDTILGSNFVIQSPTSPQAVLSTNGAPSFNGNTGVVSATGLTSEWEIGTDANSIIGMAYCYAGFSDAFFDLTNPANLNQFITTSLTPANLGYSGTNPTNQGNGHALTPLFMHTGNMEAENIPIPTPWRAVLDYVANVADRTLSAWVEFPQGSSDIYFAIENSGPSFGGPAQPDISPSFWTGPVVSPYAEQFTYNGADGRIWDDTGGVVTSPSQPPTGA